MSRIRKLQQTLNPQPENKIDLSKNLNPKQQIDPKH